MASLKPAAEAWFAPALDTSRHFKSLSVYTQAEPGTPFILSARVQLG
jgi:hypothetical protein